MNYRVLLSEEAVVYLKNIDKSMAVRIYAWSGKNLEGCTNPRRIGKAPKGSNSGEWRYRVGDYRLLATIEDEVITIYIFEIGHRSNVYD